jgi:CCR4-NOT transcription complex subunit 6
LLDKRCLELSQLAINRPDMKGTQDVYNRVMPRDNIAVVCFFENRQYGARLMVVNAHLHWDQEYKDVKVVQVAILLHEMQSLARDFCKIPALSEEAKRAFRFANGDHPDDEDPPRQPPTPKPSMLYTDPLSIPLLLCGDFNSLPNSGPYELISQGALAPNHEDIENRNYGAFTREGIKHPFMFDSAYAKIGELPFTNYVSNFMGVVDYMWYAKNSLTVRALVGKVDPEYISRVPGFPNVHFPSDHVALMAEFGIKKRVVPGGNKD